jgi:4-hydroxy-tetrahydrodipicolinate reductase
VAVRVGVVGAAGRMGAEVCRAVAGADGLELVAAVDVSAAGDRSATTPAWTST